MSQTIIRFEFKVDGALTDVTSVVLSDPTGAFGVRRTDTNAVVVADGTALTKESTGVYSYTFTDPVAGLTYNYWLEYVYDGATYRSEQNKSSVDAGAASGTISATGRYIAASDLENAWGAENIRRWADLNNNRVTSEISANVQSAIDWAEAAIDNAFRASVFTIPLSPVDDTIIGWATALAGAALYAQRGLNDTGDQQAGKMADAEKSARASMRSFVSMAVRGPWSRSVVQPTSPVCL